MQSGFLFKYSILVLCRTLQRSQRVLNRAKLFSRQMRHFGAMHVSLTTLKRSKSCKVVFSPNAAFWCYAGQCSTRKGSKIVQSCFLAKCSILVLFRAV